MSAIANTYIDVIKKLDSVCNSVLNDRQNDALSLEDIHYLIQLTLEIDNSIDKIYNIYSKNLAEEDETDKEEQENKIPEPKSELEKAKEERHQRSTERVRHLGNSNDEDLE